MMQKIHSTIYKNRDLSEL